MLEPSSQNINEISEVSSLKPSEQRLRLYSLALQLEGSVLPHQALEGLTGKVITCLWVDEG